MKKNLLFVCGHQDVFLVAEAILRKKYTLRYAENTEKAFEILKEHSIKLVFTAAKYKDKRFRDFLEELRKSHAGTRGYTQIPTAVISSEITPQFAEEIGKSGIDYALELPFEPVSFGRFIDNIIETAVKPYEKPDPVTGLPKIKLAEEEIDELLGDGKKGALFLIELAHYSFANSGVSAETRIKFRNILQSYVKPDAVIAATPTGAFTLFVPGIRAKQETEDYANALIRNVNAKIQNEKICVAVGIAVSDRHGAKYRELYAMCDKGLSLSRQNGKNAACCYKW